MSGTFGEGRWEQEGKPDSFACEQITQGLHPSQEHKTMTERQARPTGSTRPSTACRQTLPSDVTHRAGEWVTGSQACPEPPSGLLAPRRRPAFAFLCKHRHTYQAGDGKRREGQRERTWPCLVWVRRQQEAFPDPRQQPGTVHSACESAVRPRGRRRQSHALLWASASPLVR